MKKALILAAGLGQGELAKRLKKRGYYVVMTDYTPEPVGKKYCDKFYNVSTLDVEAVENIAVSENVQLIMTVCTDQAMVTVGKLSQKFGLPCYVSGDTAKKMTDKLLMKRIFKENGVPTSKFNIYRYNDGCDFEKTVEGLNFPVVIKPGDANSSKGVKKVFDIEELKRQIPCTLKYSRSKEVIIEEFKEGIELSCDFIVLDGEAILLCVSKSGKARSDDKFVICSSTYRKDLVDDDVKKQIVDIANAIVKAYGLVNCPMLIQMLWDGCRLSVIEFSARTGGCIKHRLIENVSGVDIIDKTVDITLGEKVEIENCRGRYYNKCVENKFVYCNDGEFLGVDGFDELADLGVVDEWYVFANKGDRVGGVNSSSDRVCCYTVVGDDVCQLNEKLRIANEKIRVLDIEGKDIARHDILMQND